jgi:exopolysaccharide biosynthesis polyprenyl glycosylphosphotransferase
MSHIEDVTVLELRSAKLSTRDRVLKRVMDVTLASIGLVLLLPIFLALAILIKVDSRGPVFFRSRRLGRAGKPFHMLKFRSMVTDADGQRAALASFADNGHSPERHIFKLKGDPRVTRVGQWLRRLSLDELPQLVNVLRGEMSLVGPRPLPLHEAEQCREWERKRMNVLPGITGYWQIMGRSDLGFEEMMRLDYLYLQNWSLVEDLRILVNTIGAVLAQKGAY